MTRRSTNWKLLLLLLCGSVVGTPVLADFVAYSGRDSVTESAGGFTAAHQHDWMKRSRLYWFQRWPASSIFWSRNDYSWVELRQGGKTLFRRPTIALDEIHLFPRYRILVGVSFLKYRNPYQLVAYDFDGELMFRSRMTDIDDVPQSVTNFILWKSRGTPIKLSLENDKLVGIEYVDGNGVNRHHVF